MTAVDLLTGVVFAAAKVGVLVAVASALAIARRRAPATARYGIWAAALAGALLLPAVTPWVPSWTLWTLPQSATSVAPAPELSPGDQLPGFRAVRFQDEDRCSGCEVTPQSLAVTPESWRAGAFKGFERARATAFRVSAATWFLGLWMAGSAVIVLRLGRSLFAVRHLERSASSVDGAWLAALAEARDRVGVSREVRLLRSRRVRTPMTWGAMRPVILVPEASRDWDEERRRIVLHHELSHVRRGDWLARLLAQTVCSVYWLNPLVWLAGRRMVLEQERACDEAVVALGDRPSSYARHLLAIAASMRRCSLGPTLALDMARRSQMEGRLMSILDDSRNHRTGRALLVPALALIGLVPALAAIEPWGEGGGLQIQGEDLTPGPVLISTGAGPTPAPGAVFDAPGSAGPTSSLDTSGVSRALVELKRLERALAPFERELEAIESEMEPIEEALEDVEDRFEPFEEVLEAQQAELEPYEERLEAMESELEPYEDRLEALEAELAPYEERLEALEGELEPFEQSLEGLEADLEPFEEQLEAMELELEPAEERLELMEDELGPYEDQLEAIERELEPFEEQLEDLEEQMEPVHDELDQLSDRFDRTDSVSEREGLREQMNALHERLEPLRRQMQGIHESMRPVHERMRAIHEEMRPVHERARAIHGEMRPVHERSRAIHEAMRPVHERMRAIHEEMGPVHERMRTIHEEMRPVHENLRGIHEEMRPVYERMRTIHEEMQPVHERMNEIHEQMRPVHDAMGEQHERMEPYHRKMSDIHERMRPLHQELAVHHRAMEQELVGVVEKMLAAHLGSIVPPGADFSGAAYEIVDDSAIRVNEGRLRLLSSTAALREFLEERFASEAGTQSFDAALRRFLEAYSSLEIVAS